MHKDYLKNFHLYFFQDLYQKLMLKNLPYQTKSYKKQQMIALASSKCEKIGIITSGNATIEHVLEDGRKITIKKLSQYDIFGEILLFSKDQIYPYSIISTNNCDILFITKEILLKIFKEDIDLLEKYLYHISQSYMNLNKYIKLKSQKTIISKLAYYFIYYEDVAQNSYHCHIESKTYLADFFGVERQSLFRELNHLKEIEVLDFKHNDIYIKDYEYFKKLIE